MNALVTIQDRQIGETLIPTVNLRELHEFVGSQRQFADWAKKRLNECMAEEGVDYLSARVVSQNCESKKQGGDRRSIDYHVTLDTAKHIGMLERNAKGKQIRDYFIACEKKLMAPRPMDVFDMLRQILGAKTQCNTAADILKLILPTGNYAERSSDGRQKIGLRRAAWSVIGRKKQAKELNRLCGQWIQLTLNIQHAAEMQLAVR